jgi:hypothetical protein
MGSLKNTAHSRDGVVPGIWRLISVLKRMERVKDVMEIVVFI